MAIAIAGMLSLAVAMGIGRFAFTPILPMMLAQGLIDLPGASWLASANYFGYLVGALICTLQPWIWARWPRLPSPDYSTLVKTGLVATTLLTPAMAVDWPSAWVALRFTSGVASAFVFVYTSGWCLARLAGTGSTAIGGVIYAGPGIGIVVSGVSASAMVAAQWSAVAAWLIFGVLAALMTLVVWRIFQGGGERLAPAPKRHAALQSESGFRADDTGFRADDTGFRDEHRGQSAEMGVLATAYGLAGFGYIITATFLPVIARESLPGSRWLDLFWPIFGCGVIIGALLATRVSSALDRRPLLCGCYLTQAIGIGWSLLSPSATGFIIGSLLLGIPFTAITFFAMQEARRLKPATAAGFIGLLTATYGIGQVIGPPIVAALLAHSADARQGFDWSLELAAMALLAGAALYVWLYRAYPISRAASSSF